MDYERIEIVWALASGQHPQAGTQLRRWIDNRRSAPLLSALTAYAVRYGHHDWIVPLVELALHSNLESSFRFQKLVVEHRAEIAPNQLVAFWRRCRAHDEHVQDDLEAAALRVLQRGTARKYVTNPAEALDLAAAGDPAVVAWARKRVQAGETTADDYLAVRILARASASTRDTSTWTEAKKALTPLICDRGGALLALIDSLGEDRSSRARWLLIRISVMPGLGPEARGRLVRAMESHLDRDRRFGSLLDLLEAHHELAHGRDPGERAVLRHQRNHIRCGPNQADPAEPQSAPPCRPVPDRGDPGE